MRIFVYEHVTGGGMIDGPSPQESSLFKEAGAMIGAVTHQFIALPDVELVLLLDDRVQVEWRADVRADLRRVATRDAFEREFDDAVATSDFVMLIAPESGGTLANLARRVERLNGRLMSPSSEFCDWAGDKTVVAETLQNCGTPMPLGVKLRYDAPLPDDISFPAVLKPNDGCGSQGVKLLRNRDDDARNDSSAFWRLERFVEGQAASIAFIGGAGGYLPLLPCLQNLSDDGTFHYLGGSCPIPQNLYDRMMAVVNRAWKAIPEFNGYIGIDLVLGPNDDGTEDYLIEINPRLTTSYLGNQFLIRENVMQLILDLQHGREVDYTVRGGSISFYANGTIGGVYEAD